MQSGTPNQEVARVRPDAKGRIVLGKIAYNISSYIVFKQPDGNLLLEPLMEIPAREKWLFDNPEALSSVKRGLKQSAEGKVVSRGSFRKFADDAI